MVGDARQFDEAVVEAVRPWGVAVGADHLEMFRRHFAAVLEANRAFNLTRITDPLDAAVKHYADSLAILPWVEARGPNIDPVVDIGTGAGFPAVPLAIMRPDGNVTALDATRKKIDFLARVARDLQLARLRAEHAHSEHWKPARTYRLAVLRAVAKLDVCLKQAAGCLAPGGWLVAFKSFPIEPAELESARAVLGRLQLRECDCFPYDLVRDADSIHRALYVFQRNA